MIVDVSIPDLQANHLGSLRQIEKHIFESYLYHNLTFRDQDTREVLYRKNGDRASYVIKSVQVSTTTELNDRSQERIRIMVHGETDTGVHIPLYDAEPKYNQSILSHCFEVGRIKRRLETLFDGEELEAPFNEPGPHMNFSLSLPKED